MTEKELRLEIERLREIPKENPEDALFRIKAQQKFVEAHIIRSALEQACWKITAAAKTLRISPGKLKRRMATYCIHRRLPS